MKSCVEIVPNQEPNSALPFFELFKYLPEILYGWLPFIAAVQLSRTNRAFADLFPSALKKTTFDKNKKNLLPIFQRPLNNKLIQDCLKEFDSYLEEIYSGYNYAYITPYFGHKKRKTLFLNLANHSLLENQEEINTWTLKLIEELISIRTSLVERCKWELKITQEKAYNAKIAVSVVSGISAVLSIFLAEGLWLGFMGAIATYASLGLAIIIPTTFVVFLLVLLLVSLSIVYLTEYFNAKEIKQDFLSMKIQIDNFISEQENLVAADEAINRARNCEQLIALIREEEVIPSDEYPVLKLIENLIKTAPGLSAENLLDSISKEQIIEIDHFILNQTDFFATDRIRSKNRNCSELIGLIKEDKYKINIEHPALLLAQKQLKKNPNLSATAFINLINEEIKELRTKKGFFTPKPKENNAIWELFNKNDFDLNKPNYQKELIACLKGEITLKDNIGESNVRNYLIK